MTDTIIRIALAIAIAIAIGGKASPKTVKTNQQVF